MAASGPYFLTDFQITLQYLLLFAHHAEPKMLKMLISKPHFFCCLSEVYQIPNPTARGLLLSPLIVFIPVVD